MALAKDVLASPAAVMKNMKTVQYIHTVMTIFIGAIVGILGITGLRGFALFALLHAVVSGASRRCIPPRLCGRTCACQ
jgi:hypothetical protein